MKKGDKIEGKVVKYTFPNIGTVDVCDNEEIIHVKVKNAIIGQTIRGTVNKKKHGLYEARLEEVIKRAENETADPCPHYKECGGCTYQTFPYEEQIKIKEKQILDLLKNALSYKAEDIDKAYEGDIVDYNGRPYHYYTPSGVYLEKASYSFDISMEYINFLKGVFYTK